MNVDEGFMKNETELVKRRANRLPEFDYAQNGVYFLTICTQNRAQVLSIVPVGAASGRQPQVQLTGVGEIVAQTLEEIPLRYSHVSVDHYVIMPDHVHWLLRVERKSGRPLAAPTVSHIVNQWKGAVTRRLGKAIWQKGFYDHIVRDVYDYQVRWQYMEENPQRWLQKTEQLERT